MTVRSGGCLCGAVRFEATGEPDFTGICHCTHCQRQNGSAFLLFAVYPAEAVNLTGELTCWRDHGEAGRFVDRCFCATCGAPIWSVSERRPGTVSLRAGAFDDASWFRPEGEAWLRSAHPWLADAHDWPEYDLGFDTAPRNR